MTKISAEVESINKIRLFLFVATVFLWNNNIFSQKEPLWTKSAWRETNYPNNEFFIGYQMGNKRSNETLDVAKNRISKEAQALLSESVSVNIQSAKSTKTSSVSKGDYEQINSKFESAIQTFSNIEIIGIKNEIFYDEKSEIIYAFAYVKKSELKSYYKNNLNLTINQIASFEKTAKDLETNGEKVKARQEIEKAKSLFENLYYSQTMLVVLDANINNIDLQQTKTEQLYNSIVQMQARMAQSIYVFVESSENLFGKRVDIVVNKLKAELSTNGCSFVDVLENADFKISINVSTRIIGNQGVIIFCSADAEISLYDIHKQKTIYNDAISQKGNSNTEEKAGRIAMNNVAPEISKILIDRINQ